MELGENGARSGGKAFSTAPRRYEVLSKCWLLLVFYFAVVTDFRAMTEAYY